MLDFEIIQTFLSKEPANEEARKLLGQWKQSKRPEESVVDTMNEGLVVGSLLGSSGVQKQMLLVHFDDGKVEKDGVVGY